MRKSKCMLGFGMMVFMLFALLLCSQRTYAQGTYKWVDEKGTVHFTDDPGTIPDKDKNKIKQDNRDIRQDWKDIGKDTRDIRQDRADIQQDTKDIREDRRDIQRDDEKMRADRKALADAVKSGDKDKIAEARKNLRSDINQRNKDVRNLNAVERERRRDTSTTSGAGTNATSNNADKTNKPHPKYAQRNHKE